MPHGIISRFSEVMEWKIPDFFSLIVMKDSPRFSFAGCQWYLVVHPKSVHFSRCTTVYLCVDKDSIETAPRTVTYILGLMNSNGFVEEVGRECRTYDSVSLCGGAIAKWKREDLQSRSSELVPSGVLTITCRMEREISTPEEIAPQSDEVHSPRKTFVDLEALSSDFSGLFSDERKHDVTIDVQGKAFRVHRTVLAARSSVFRAMYEHDTAEAKSGLLTIPDCDPDTFGDFLRYLYSGKMEKVSFRTAYHLYSTAEKYDVQQLKSFCADYLEQNLTTENVCDAVILADKYGDDRLMSRAQDYFNENPYEILLTSEWKSLMANNLRLSSQLLSEMAAAALKTPRSTSHRS